MGKEELIKSCRYYNGEDENPFNSRESREAQNKSMLWHCERSWVTDTLNTYKDGNDRLEDAVQQYVSSGLTTYMPEDNVPASLKAVIFNRFMKDSFDSNPEPFKRFYKKYYK